MTKYRPWFKPEYLDPESLDRANRKAARHALERAHVILRNMAEERPGFWAALFGRRWPIHHEPLRGDARNALAEINSAIVKLIRQEQGE